MQKQNANNIWVFSWQLLRIIVCLASNCSVPGFQHFSYAWIAPVDDACILKINSVAFESRMAGNIGTPFKNFGVLHPKSRPTSDRQTNVVYKIPCAGME